MKLSILIPTLNEPDSIGYLARLRGILDPQIASYPGQVQIHIHDAGRSMPTGVKRNELIANSEGEYFSMIDCDDIVTEDYVKLMMMGINENPDCVTLQGWMTTNGRHKTDWIIKLGEKYEERQGKYYRWPNHLAAMKRSCVQHVKFPGVWQQEDYIWSKQIRDMGLLKSEVHIQKQIYHYDFKTNKPAYAKSHSIR